MSEPWESGPPPLVGPAPRLHKIGFLDLPAELRIKVYEIILDDLLRASRTFRGSRIAMMRSQSALPYACQQIRREVNQHFRTRYLGLKL